MQTRTLTLKRARRLRKALTPQELGLWSRLKARQVGGFRFRRLHPVGPYILDFYCPEARLAVEIDGAAHHLPDQVEHDRRRDAFLRERGIETLRIGASALKRPGAVAEQILEALRRR